jgi:hypothetical protein
MGVGRRDEGLGGEGNGGMDMCGCAGGPLECVLHTPPYLGQSRPVGPAIFFSFSFLI